MKRPVQRQGKAAHADRRAHGPDRRSGGGGGANWRRWFYGFVLAAALTGAVLHWGEVEQFARLAREARPGWLALAVLFQLSTYASVAAGWAVVLRRAGTPRGMGPLMRIAVTKLFADQAVPSAGMGGNVLLVGELRALGVPQSTGVAALLLSVIGYYIAYALCALAMLILLWLHDEATPLMAGLVTLFLCVAFAIPALALWLRKRGSKPLPRRIERIGVVRSLLQTVAQAPSVLLRDRLLLIRVTFCNGLVFLADAATLYCCLHALGLHGSFNTAFIALVMASIVVTLGPIPLGLGSFEVTATGTLRLLGVPFEAAFAATMLLRLLTLWLPLLPGMALMHGVIRRGGKPMARQDGGAGH